MNFALWPISFALFKRCGEFLQHGLADGLFRSFCPDLNKDDHFARAMWATSYRQSFRVQSRPTVHRRDWGRSRQAPTSSEHFFESLNPGSTCNGTTGAVQDRSFEPLAPSQ